MGGGPSTVPPTMIPAGEGGVALQDFAQERLMDMLSGDMPRVSQAPMPTAQWFQGLSPEVMAGLWAPYEQAGQQLTERLGSIGGMGSQVAGASGAGAAALGKFYEQAGQNIGLNAWQMTAPGAFAQWQAEDARRMMPFTAAPSLWQYGKPTITQTQTQPGAPIGSTIGSLMGMGMGGLLGFTTMGPVGGLMGAGMGGMAGGGFGSLFDY